MMFFRKWRQKRREAIARQWMDEMMSLPPPAVPVLEIDEVELERWQQTQAASCSPNTPPHAFSAAPIDPAWVNEQLIPWVGERLERLEKALEGHRKHINFLEGQRIRGVRQFAVAQSLLESFIRTHQRPDLLVRWWHQEVPNLIDEVSEVPPELPDDYQEEALAWQAMVKRYTYLIEEAATYYEKHREDDD